MGVFYVFLFRKKKKIYLLIFVVWIVGGPNDTKITMNTLKRNTLIESRI